MREKTVKSKVNGTKRNNGRIRNAVEYIGKNKYMYILLIPGIIYYIVFRYWPIYGVSIAFKDFSIYDGIAASPWNNFEHFKTLLGSEQFFRILRNSALLGLLKLVFSFPFII